MNLLNSILKVFVGDKAKKDIKEISPLVSKINSIENEFIKLSNDELRARTTKFKSEITNLKNPFQNRIDSINDKEPAVPRGSSSFRYSIETSS